MRYEVCPVGNPLVGRLDGPVTEILSVAGDVHNAGREPEWLLSPEARRHAESQAIDRYADADADSCHPCNREVVGWSLR